LNGERLPESDRPRTTPQPQRSATVDRCP
jgi:hypothetical protein